MWPGFLAAQIVREYSLLLIFLCKIFPEKLDKARGGRRGILDSPFQSTPPARGATGDVALLRELIVDISIHAPREGGATAAYQELVGVIGISIHAPREGGDGFPQIAYNVDTISIHAPREGGDFRALLNQLKLTISIHAPPRGGRPQRHGYSHHRYTISIHAPREGGDQTAKDTDSATDISIHAPREGGDSAKLFSPSLLIPYFNPRKSRRS